MLTHPFWQPKTILTQFLHGRFFVATNKSIEQIVDSLCDALLQDEGTLNNRERELLAGVLQHVRGDEDATSDLGVRVTEKVTVAVRSVVAKRVLSTIVGVVAERLSGAALDATLDRKSTR